MAEAEMLLLVADTIADGIRTTVQDLDRCWRLVASLHVKRGRLQCEAEKLAAQMEDNEELRVKFRSLRDEAESLSVELNELEEEITYLEGCRDGFLRHLEYLGETCQSPS